MLGRIGFLVGLDLFNASCRGTHHVYIKSVGLLQEDGRSLRSGSASKGRSQS